MQTCPQCKARQLNGVLFCAECGSSLFEAGARPGSTASLGASKTGSQAALVDNAEPAPAPPSNALTLIVVSSGRRISVDASDDLLVGRKDNTRGIYPDIDLGLDGGYDAGVSRRHAIIAPATGGWMIEDLASANGTFVNGQRLAPNAPALAQAGDEIAFGTLLLRIE